MKIFFVSDLHGSLPATQLAIEKFIASDAEHLILLGDVLYHGPRNPIPQGYDPKAVAELLNRYAHKIIAVRGNCDSEVDQALLTFPIMSDFTYVLLESGQRLFLTHGHLYHKDNTPPLNHHDVIVHGHTHIPVAEQYGEQFLFNPGSVTFPRDNHPASYGVYQNAKLSVLDFDDREIASVAI